MDVKRKLIVLAVPALLASGGASLVAVHAATPNPSPSGTQAPSGSTQTAEPAESAAEPAGTADPAEPAGTATGASVGHADNPNDPNADHQFDGQE